MKKKFYDIIPNDQRSIRNIPLDVTRLPEEEKEHYFDVYASKHKKKKIESIKTRKKHVTSHTQELHTPINEVYDDESYERWHASKKRKYVWGIAFVLLLLVGYAIVSLFSSAEVFITPASHTISLQKTKIALKDIKNTLIEFDVVESTTTDSGGLIEINSKASGTIVLYNAYGTAPIKIPNGASLIAPNSLVYKTLSQVTIPGYKIVGGKQIPGSVEVKIEGELAGENYNAPFTDFSIVSFKNTDKFKKVYGRSKTELSGGLKGQVPKISKEVISQITSDVSKKVASSSAAQIVSKTLNIDPRFVYIPNLTYITYEKPEQKPSSDGKKLTMEARAHGIIILLDRESLAEQIMKEYPLPDKEQIGGRVIFDIDTTKVTATMQADLDTDSVRKNFVYLFFTGDTVLTSLVNKEIITSAISGLSKNQAMKVLPDLVEVKNLSIKTHPWWNDRLPLNKGKIRVISQ